MKMLYSFFSSGNLFVKRAVVYNRRSCHHFLPSNQRGGLQAAVLPVAPPILDDEETRKQMAEDFGFTQIGEELPDSVTLKDVMDTLPKEVPAANTSMILMFYLHKFLLNLSTARYLKSMI